MGITDTDNLTLNVGKDIPDNRDLLYNPSLQTLSPEISPPHNLYILDQGREGACTGFGLAAAINFLNQRRGEAPRKVSVRMLYEMAKRYDEWPGEQYDGSSCRGAIKGWYHMGVCEDALWAYHPNRIGTLTPEAVEDARSNAPGAYYRVLPRLSDFHAALNETGCIFCSASVHEGWFNPDNDTGLIEMHAGSTGGHAFAIVGYNSEGFWVQNSWGPDWGVQGLALWTYEDWQQNIYDAWVFSLALKVPQKWHETISSPDEARSRHYSPPSVRRSDIEYHFVHIDDGHFHTNGTFWSSREDVQQAARVMADREDIKHLMFYAHGGLNTPSDSADRIYTMKDVFLANGIYPFHFMYDTGLVETILDILLGKREKVISRVGSVLELRDKLIERWTRKAGKALWHEMKDDARLPFTKKTAAGTRTLEDFLDVLSEREDIKIHLVGHSTGAILVGHLLQRLSKLHPDYKQVISSCSLMAPAATTDFFNANFKPLLRKRGFRIDQLDLYALTDAIERADSVTAGYGKSLLYLVSNAFEDEKGAPLSGMQNFHGELPPESDRFEIHLSEGPNGNPITQAKDHGHFDQDPATMNSILRRILDDEPVRRFTNRDLNPVSLAEWWGRQVDGETIQ